jgi:hypothetical protein
MRLRSRFVYPLILHHEWLLIFNASHRNSFRPPWALSVKSISAMTQMAAPRVLPRLSSQRVAMATRHTNSTTIDSSTAVSIDRSPPFTPFLGLLATLLPVSRRRGCEAVVLKQSCSWVSRLARLPGLLSVFAVQRWPEHDTGTAGTPHRHPPYPL